MGGASIDSGRRKKPPVDSRSGGSTNRQNGSFWRITMKKSTIKTTAFWLTTILGPTSFVIGGVLGIQQSPEVVSGIHHLGYPLYFATLLSVWKLLGAIAITAPGLPRLKEWAYAGFMFDLTGAAISHAAVGDATGDIVAPLVFLVLVAASYILRPESRRMTAPAGQPARAATLVTAPAGA
jgi:uncharacterized membrane protein YphA (DoxX/SURF4 family)